MIEAPPVEGVVSRDELDLYYGFWPSESGATPVMCLPGLTRNSRDFEQLAPRLAAERAVVVTDFRGRGLSSRDPQWQRYQPATYRDDAWAILDYLDIGRVILIGTSLGGIVAALMAAQRPERVAAVVLNDIGPEIDPRGLARISEYTGRLAPVLNWEEAVRQSHETYGAALPGLDERRWLRAGAAILSAERRRRARARYGSGHWPRTA